MNARTDYPRFPAGFVWGASTSAYQIEGAAHADGRGPSIWDSYSRIPGKVSNGDTGDVACDHYHRYAEDVALMKRLGLDAYRFSIAWPRVLPDGRGEVNEAGLAFYDRLVDALLAAGIAPWICLYHWDLPQALDDLGGWTDRRIADWFGDYATLIATRLGDRVRHFATFNEPAVATIFGYGIGWNAPGKKDRAAYYRASHHLNLAHGTAVAAIRANAPGAWVGAIHNLQPCWPAGPSEDDKAAARMQDAHWNRLFPGAQIEGAYPPEIERHVASLIQSGDMERIRQPLDWFGLNHYSPIYAKAGPDEPLEFTWTDAPEGVEKSDIGWPIRPDAFRDQVLEVHRRYRLPIYVTENGYGGPDAPDAEGRIQDDKRIAFLDAYIRAMAEAMDTGADVRGYFVWSLLDNFEWGAGYGVRFGLIHVDYKNQRRTPKDSFAWYSRLIHAGRGA